MLSGGPRRLFLLAWPFSLVQKPWKKFRILFIHVLSTSRNVRETYWVLLSNISKLIKISRQGCKDTHLLARHLLYSTPLQVHQTWYELWGWLVTHQSPPARSRSSDSLGQMVALSDWGQGKVIFGKIQDPACLIAVEFLCCSEIVEVLAVCPYFAQGKAAILPKLALWWTSDGHGYPMGQKEVTHTRTRQDPYPRLRVWVTHCCG